MAKKRKSAAPKKATGKTKAAKKKPVKKKAKKKPRKRKKYMLLLLGNAPAEGSSIRVSAICYTTKEARDRYDEEKRKMRSGGRFAIVKVEKVLDAKPTIRVDTEPVKGIWSKE